VEELLISSDFQQNAWLHWNLFSCRAFANCLSTWMV